MCIVSIHSQFTTTDINTTMVFAYRRLIENFYEIELLKMVLFN